MTQQLFAVILTAFSILSSWLCFRKNEESYDLLSVVFGIGALAGLLWLACDFGSNLPHGTWWVK